MIYVNGDSFTSGVGLSDHEFVPDFEKYNIDNISINDYVAIRQSLLSNYDKYTAYKKRNKELSWPALMGKILGTEVINAGERGSSMSSILYRTLLDITKLQMKGITPERVIIMLTSPNRVSFIQIPADKNLPSVDFDGEGRRWIESIVLGNTDINIKLKNLLKETIQTHTDGDLLIKWLLEIALIKNVVKSLTGKYPIIAILDYMILYYKTQATILNISNNSAFSELISASDILNIDSTLSMHPINLLPDRHYDNESHEIFAHKVAKYIQTLNNKENNI